MAARIALCRAQIHDKERLKAKSERVGAQESKIETEILSQFAIGAQNNRNDDGMHCS